MEPNEVVPQFMVTLADYFDRWIDLAKVEKTFDELREFIVVEQFMHAVPNDVSVYLRERKERKMDKVVKIAEALC